MSISYNNDENNYIIDDYESSDEDEAPLLMDLGPTVPIISPASNDTIIEHENEHRDDDEDKSLLSSVVPVTILTGFLGSGKTTLIQYILRSEEHGKKIAIIENEFSGASAAIGDSITAAEREGLSIETMIARDGTNNSNLADLIELPNGCICCTVKDSLVETLEALLSKKKELDYIIIECSGMANPGPIASIFWLDDALESRLRLDGIVACVDARNLEMQLSETTSVANRELILKEDDNLKTATTTTAAEDIGGDEAAQQIAFADRIIINKIDLLGDSGSSKEEDKNTAKIERVVQQVRAINATAPILTTTYSQVTNLDWVLDAKCFDIERVKDVEASFDVMEKDIHIESEEQNCIDANCFVHRQKRSPIYEQDNAYCTPCSPPPPPSSEPSYNHSHTNAISTIALVEKGSVNLKRINTWLASILWPDQDKDDNILKAQLEELERLNQITTPEIMDKRRKDELMNQMHIFRIKGILSIQHDDSEIIDIEEKEFICEGSIDKRKFIVQAVNDLWEIHAANSSECWIPDDKRICKVVIIGRNLKSEQLLSDFKSCFVG
jgi:G3E family GTPase